MTERRNDEKKTNGDDWQSLSRDELKERCIALLTQENILLSVEEAARSHGFVGPTTNVKLVYLATMTRLFPRVVSVILMGPSSAGKSETIKAALKLHPPEAFIELTAMSDKALYYMKAPFSHRMLVIYETAGLSGDFLTYGLRSLLSEGCLKYDVTVVERQETVRLEKDGPTGLLSSNAGATERQLATRVLSPTVSDDEELTREILLAAARGKPTGVDLEPFHAMQRFIAPGQTEVSLPFGERLAKETDARAVRMRRDFPAVLSLTRAHALLHQESRERAGDGSVVAEPDDYAAVYGLVADTVAEGAERAVPPEVREIVRAVSDIYYRVTGGPSEPVTMIEIAEKIGKSRPTASRNANRAAKLGYLVDVGDQRRHRYVPGDPMPEDRGVLPPPEILD